MMETAAHNATPVSQDTHKEGMPSPTFNDLKTALVNTESEGLPGAKESEGLPRVNIEESEGLHVAVIDNKLVRVRVLVNNFAGSGMKPQGLTGQNTKRKADKKDVIELESNKYKKKVLEEMKADGHTKICSDTRLYSSNAIKMLLLIWYAKSVQ